MENKDSEELEFNKKNREDFEQLMKDSVPNHDDYWDRSNPFVKILLLILGVIIILGVIYYVIMYMNQ